MFWVVCHSIRVATSSLTNVFKGWLGHVSSFISRGFYPYLLPDPVFKLKQTKALFSSQIHFTLSLSSPFLLHYSSRSSSPLILACFFWQMLVVASPHMNPQFKIRTLKI
ncbi:hypothetical protein QVD17_15249 [Tagetes erecta]|uniref:Uncharacterized protein n=1 Tax=Tagetes erecta TaxID=13708 RepID=A0AAD8NYH7_TARER|nr:hypothetical protein QVD17_15249 [Tagetes erecta]